MPHHLLWSAEQNYLMVLQQKVFHSQHTNLEAILTLVKLRSETFQLIHRVIFALLNFAGSPISRAILILSCWQELEQEMIMSTKNIWLWAQRRIGIIKISSNTEQTDLIKNIFSILGTKKNLSKMRIKVWDQSNKFTLLQSFLNCLNYLINKIILKQQLPTDETQSCDRNLEIC